MPTSRFVALVSAPRRLARTALLLGLPVVCFGCATPAERADREAQQLSFARRIVPGGAFQHTVYHADLEDPEVGVHVYLAGDAAPRRAARFRPPDATPRPVRVLELMALDPHPRLLLGRPCAFGTPQCAAQWWTSARFGEPVVESLARALGALLAEHGKREVVLIGHSGGGALAMLLAERVPETRAVVTLAGNLDVGAWQRHHGFLPLEGSLDPAARPPLPARIFQLHLLAGRDARVPPTLVQAAIARQPDARVRVFPRFDHGCCWAEVWPQVLSELARELR